MIPFKRIHIRLLGIAINLSNHRDLGFFVCSFVLFFGGVLEGFLFEVLRGCGFFLVFFT